MVDPEFAGFRPPSLDRLGTSEVEQLETQTRALRKVDYQCGGGMCRDAVVVRVHWGHEMLRMHATDPVRQRLFIAVADLHNLAGWVCFDSGHMGAAHHHFDVALGLAGQGGDDDLVANVHYRQGRVNLHYGALDEALSHFQCGQLAAQRSGSRLAASILYVNQAWAYAKKGEEELTLRLLDRAKAEFAAATGPSPDWARFFTETDLSATIGTVLTELALTADSRHTREAIPALTEAMRGYGPDMARSRSFCLIALATCYLVAGEADEGCLIGSQAVSAGETLRSVRTKDRLRPLKQETDKRADHSASRALSDFITAFVTSPTHV